MQVLPITAKHLCLSLNRIRSLPPPKKKQQKKQDKETLTNPCDALILHSIQLLQYTPRSSQWSKNLTNDMPTK